MMHSVDVLVIGAGAAGVCAAIAASKTGAKVQVLEWAPLAHSGGNLAFAHGSFRTAYESACDLQRLMPDLGDDDWARTDFGTYSARNFLDDLVRLSQGRTDKALAKVLAGASLGTLEWLTSHGVRFQPIYSRQAVTTAKKVKFSGGLSIEAAGGGKRLLELLYAAAKNLNVEIQYGIEARELIHSDGTIVGVRVDNKGTVQEVFSKSVVLASGGFQANAEWRARYLGPNWDLAKVRGSRFNTGNGIRMALEIGARPYGHWSGCHSVFCDLAAPDFGDPNLHDLQKNCFHLGVVVNKEGSRFVDEGADFRNYTYARMGSRVLQQPSAIGWQIFDEKAWDFLLPEYKNGATCIVANTIDELVQKMEGVNERACKETLASFNASAVNRAEFDLSIKDGKSTSGLLIPKSNWAVPLDTPPYRAFPVTAAITNSFGGVCIDAHTRVLRTDQTVCQGLFAAGDIVGGLYYFDHPGGSGLTAATVFGKIAGEQSASYARAL